MSFLGFVGGILVGGIVGFATGNFALGLSAGMMTMGALNRAGGTPAAAEQGDQREIVLDTKASIPVVYGRAIVAPKLAYVTTSGSTNEKLYLVGVLAEGVVAAIEEIYLDGNCAVLADGTVRAAAPAAALTVSAVDLGTPCRVHCTAHGFVTGDSVRVAAGSLAADYLVTVLDADHFTVPATSTTTAAGIAQRLNPGYRSPKDGTTRLVRFAKYRGTDAQDAASNPGDANGPTADSTMAVHDVPGWSGALSGLAYLVLELWYAPGTFPGGVPAVTVMVKGRTVYDPRIASTAWSDNPILCYRDYLSDGARYGASSGAVRYGLGIAAADLFDGASDSEGLRALAAYCDGLVSCPAGTGLTAVSATTNAGEVLTTAKAHGLTTGDKVWVRGVSATPALADGEYEVASTPAGTTFTLTGVTFSADGGAGGTVQKVTTQARYACNGAIDTGRTLQENLNAILSSCRGFASQEGGRWSAIISREGLTPSSFTLDVTTILGDWEFSTPDAADVPNLILATFAPRLGDTQTVEWPPTTETNPYLAHDAYVPNAKELELPLTQDYYQAQRIARCALEEGRGLVGVGVTAVEGAIALSVGDIVPVTHPTPAWTAKEFEVRAIAINPDATVRLLLREYIETAYDEELTDDAPGAGTALPLPWYVAPPTAPVSGSFLSTGTGDPRIMVRWTPSADALIHRYEIRAKRTAPSAKADADYRSYGFVGRDHDTAFVGPVETGEQWTVEVVAERMIGTRSAALSGFHTVSVLGPADCTMTRDVAPAAITYHVTFGTFTYRVELYSVEHAAAAGENPPRALAYRAYELSGSPGDVVVVTIPTTANWYRRTFTVSYDRSGVAGEVSAVVEDQAYTVAGGPSAAPSLPTQGATTETSIVITWTNGDVTALTRVWVDGVVVKADVAATVDTWTIPGLTAGQTYQVKLDHYKNGQASAFCAVVAMTTSSLATAPASFAVTAFESFTYGHKEYGRFTVEWAGGSDPGGPWEIYESVANDVDTASLFASGATGLTASLERWRYPDIDFYYWVRYTAGPSSWRVLADNPLNYHDGWV